MLEINQEQMVIANDIARDNFHQRVRDYVREKLPRETNNYDNTQLIELIKRQDKIAVEHDIKTELGIVQWVCLSLGLGEDFFQQDEIKNIFDPPGELPAETRLTLYIEHINAVEKNPNARIEDILLKHGYIVER
ncbi:MAG: hypothetical protein L3J59_13390 [Methylococcaceae bacterium]|nr:hypothetical protein [Methylococcaceae bacterium]